METKYDLRKNKTPYYFEKDIVNDSGTALKEFEVFDGKEVKWGIREENLLNYSNKKLCNTTPIMQNVIDRYGDDEKRILYLKNYKCVFHGKINDSEVLGRINNCYSVEPDFVTIEDFGGEDVRIQESSDDIVEVYFKKDGLGKSLYFNYKNFEKCSNIFDAFYVDNCFLISYQIGDKVRPFIGKGNCFDGSVKSNGYDICKQEFIEFPINKEGIIDDIEMLNNIKEDIYTKGFDEWYYKSLDKRNLIVMLRSIGLDGFNITRDLEMKSKKLVLKRK